MYAKLRHSLTNFSAVSFMIIKFIPSLGLISKHMKTTTHRFIISFLVILSSFNAKGQEFSHATLPPMRPKDN
jgi:hypothetical protein